MSWIADHYVGIFLVLVFNSIVSMLFNPKPSGSSYYLVVLSCFGAILDPVSLPFYIVGILAILITYFIVEPDMASMNPIPFLVAIAVCGALHTGFIYFLSGSFKMFLLAVALLSILFSNFIHFKKSNHAKIN